MSIIQSINNIIMNNLLEFVTVTRENAGATHSLNGIENPKAGYYASIAGLEMKVPNESFGNESIQYFIGVNSEPLAEDQNFLGSWVDNGMTYLDVTRHFDNLGDAITFGMNNNQLAIYDIEVSKAIELPSNQTAGTETQRKAYIKSVVKRMTK